MTEMKRNVSGSPYTFFGMPLEAYSNGLFQNLPAWLDKLTSWCLLFGAKLLYFVGLRPSYAGVDWWVVALRGAAGLILLPGLLYAAFKAGNRHRIFFAIFLLPILIGGTQDRYNLPIQPLLFYFGYRAYEAAWCRFRSRLPTFGKDTLA